MISDSSKFDYIDNNLIQVRQYQVEIAEKCVATNSLVVIPTGLGKTIIAILLVSETLKIAPKESKVIIMAPTRPLINQHLESFEKFLDVQNEGFCILTGKIPQEKRPELFQENKFLFYTPQTLRNDLVSERYSLKDVSLIIFDEAHHTSGDYPYSLIADLYTEQNQDGSILALTASPGATKERISNLCKELHIPFDNIHVRTRQDEDVKKYIKKMDIYKVGVTLSSIYDDIYLAIHTILEEKLQYLTSITSLEQKDNSKPLFKQIYRKDLLELNSELQRKIQFQKDSATYSALSVNAQALILYHMTSLIEQQGLDVLFEYLEKLNGEIKKAKCSKSKRVLASDSRIRAVYLRLKEELSSNPKNLYHPKFPALVKILREEFDHNPNSRVLVFIKMRDTVRLIVKRLKKISEIKPHRFVGQAHKSKKDKGLSQKDQIQILKDFKEGKYNVLVSTNVGEEGLDIAECDLVVFYDVVASEIRLIQRKGRTARHKQGKVIILYCKGTNDETYMHIALSKLKKMNTNLKSPKELKQFYEEELGLDEEIYDEQEELKDVVSVDKGQGTLANFISNEEDSEKSDVKLSHCIPMRYGLRKNLRKKEIDFDVIETETFDIELFGEVFIKIYSPYEFSPRRSLRLHEQLSKQYKLIFFIYDFVDIEFKEKINGEGRFLRKRIINFGKDNHIQTIPLDNNSELIYLIESLYNYHKK